MQAVTICPHPFSQLKIPIHRLSYGHYKIKKYGNKCFTCLNLSWSTMHAVTNFTKKNVNFLFYFKYRKIIKIHYFLTTYLNLTEIFNRGQYYQILQIRKLLHPC